MLKRVFSLLKFEKKKLTFFLFSISGIVEDDIEGNTERITVGDFEPIVGPTMDYVA